MNKVLMAVFAASFSMSAHAVKRELYLVEPMECKGKSGRKSIELSLESFMSTKSDGSLANSLEWSSKSAAEESGYTGPMYLIKNKVSHKFGNIDRVLRLTVDSVTQKEGNRHDQLSGTITDNASTRDATVWKITCEATVVKKVSRIENNTQISFAVAAKNRELSKKLNDDNISEEVWGLFFNGDSVKVSTLKKDAKVAYAKADREYRMVESFYSATLDETLIHVSNVIEGNGCSYLFNRAGEYINSTCGTESGEWDWEEK